MRTPRRFSGSWALTFLALSVTVAAGGVLVLRSALHDRSAEHLRSQAALVARLVSERPPEPPRYQEIALDAAGLVGARVTLIAADGTVLGDSERKDESLLAMDSHLDRPEVQQARQRGSGRSERLSNTVHRKLLYVAILVADAEPVRYVRLAVPLSESSRAAGRFFWFLAGLGLVAGGLAVALERRAYRRFSRPLEALAVALEGSAADRAPHRGDLALPRGDDEPIHRLSSALGSMRRTMIERIQKLEDEEALWTSVLGSMHEGLLLVDSGRRVRLANHAARDIFEMPVDPNGRLLTEAVRHPGVIRCVEKTLDDGVPSGELSMRIPGSDRAFQLQVTPLAPRTAEPAREALVLLFDITRLERLESVRREFVANVSHELRTPLTSIAAFVELLSDGGQDDPGNARRFLEIVRKHTERMGELIEDLTDLSLIETGAIALDFEELAAASVVADVLEKLQPLADRRRVRLESTVPAGLKLRADRRRLEQLLTNLLDNAVKFSEPGGVVRVRGESDAAGATLAVADEGCGISADAREKIFHRFYQVDKGRSREVGGTGLGLAIVKHLMRLHGGRVRVESELGHGSVFFLDFPAEQTLRPH